MSRAAGSQVLSCEQARQFDRLATADYGLTGLVLMENAGRGVVDVLERIGIAGPVVVACGRGNNAGDGLVIARHLEIRGHAAIVHLWAAPEKLSPDAAANYRIVHRAGTPIRWCASAGAAEAVRSELAEAAWIVDALLGTGSRGRPRAPLNEAIASINATGALKMAVDLPSGLDGDTGEAAEPTLRADHTCTLVAWKRGFLNPRAAPYLGSIHVVGIGTPRRLLDEVLAAAE